MKNKITHIFSMLLFIGISMNTQAQQITNEPSVTNQDSVIIKQNNNIVIMDVKENERVRQVSSHQKRWKSSGKFEFGVGMDIGLNSYGKENVLTGNSGDDDFLVLNTSKSVGIALYPFRVEMKIAQWFSMMGGLGIGWNNYFFEECWTIINDNGITIPYDRYIDGNRNTLSKSKLATTHLNLPLLFQFQIPNKKHRQFGRHRGFFVQAGAIGGMKIGSHTKVKLLGNQKEKDFSDFNLNLLRYELTARIGYDWLSAYINYQMTPMFQTNRGPELYPFSAGLSLHF